MQQIDMTIMRAVFGNNTAELVNYIKGLIVTTSKILNDAINAIQDKNRKQAIDCFHCMKGPIGSCGFTKLYTLCEKAEEKIMLDDWDGAKKSCEDIQKTLNKLQPELEKKFKDAF